MEFTTDHVIKIILAIIGLISTIFVAIFAVNKRNHKIGNVTGDGNKIHNGDKVSKK